MNRIKALLISWRPPTATAHLRRRHRRIRASRDGFLRGFAAGLSRDPYEYSVRRAALRALHDSLQSLYPPDAGTPRR